MLLSNETIQNSAFLRRCQERVRTNDNDKYIIAKRIVEHFNTISTKEVLLLLKIQPLYVLIEELGLLEIEAVKSDQKLFDNLKSIQTIFVENAVNFDIIKFNKEDFYDAKENVALYLDSIIQKTIAGGRKPFIGKDFLEPLKDYLAIDTINTPNNELEDSDYEDLYEPIKGK